MKRVRKVHKHKPNARQNVSYCGWGYADGSSVTDDDAKVTCGNCLRFQTTKQYKYKTHTASPVRPAMWGKTAICGQWAVADSNIVKKGEEPTCNSCRKILGLKPLPKPSMAEIMRLRGVISLVYVKVTTDDLDGALTLLKDELDKE